MRLKKWTELPERMQTPEVRTYYDVLLNKRGGLFLKRVFDLLVSAVMLIVLSPVFLVLAALITADSPGGVLYRQTRVTAYGKMFRIHKFRTMVANADRVGSQVTVSGDARVTKVGHVLRRYRLDELPQLIDILQGNMSFVGTRPEVPKYVEQYTDEMWATLLLPAGVTSEASIRYKDEARLLDTAADVDETYVKQVLPGKMRYNLDSMCRFSFWGDIRTMFRTVLAVLGKEYEDEFAADEEEATAN